MEHNRSTWGSNLGFLMAAIGSAVGLGLSLIHISQRSVKT